MANYALKMLRNITLQDENGQEIPLRCDTENLFHRNDPMPITRTKGERATDITVDSRRVPDLIIIGLAAAQRVANAPQATWDQIAFGPALDKPELPFLWIENKACQEFKASRRKKKLVPLSEKIFTTKMSDMIAPQVVPESVFFSDPDFVAGSSASIATAGQSGSTPCMLLQTTSASP
jgi:hypothetical protein